jgi:hypothetical protein
MGIIISLKSNGRKIFDFSAEWAPPPGDRKKYPERRLEFSSNWAGSPYFLSHISGLTGYLG